MNLREILNELIDSEKQPVLFDCHLTAIEFEKKRREDALKKAQVQLEELYGDEGRNVWE